MDEGQRFGVGRRRWEWVVMELLAADGVGTLGHCIAQVGVSWVNIG